MVANSRVHWCIGEALSAPLSAVSCGAALLLLLLLLLQLGVVVGVLLSVPKRVSYQEGHSSQQNTWALRKESNWIGNKRGAKSSIVNYLHHWSKPCVFAVGTPTICANKSDGDNV